MERSPGVAELERYLAGALPPDEMRRIDAAVQQSPVLRSRLNRLRREQRTLALIKASFRIRLPDDEEETVAVRIGQRLCRLLPESSKKRPGES